MYYRVFIFFLSLPEAEQGFEDSLHLQDLLQLFPALLPHVGEVGVPLLQRLLCGRETLLGGIQLLPRPFQRVHQLLQLT